MFVKKEITVLICTLHLFARLSTHQLTETCYDVEARRAFARALVHKNTRISKVFDLGCSRNNLSRDKAPCQVVMFYTSSISTNSKFVVYLKT